MFKKIIFFLSLSFFILFTSNSLVKAEETIEPSKYSEEVLAREITFGQGLVFLSNYLDDLPRSYKYISLKYKGVKENTPVYEALQKLVYLDVLDNKEIYVDISSTFSRKYFYTLFGKSINLDMTQFFSEVQLEENTNFLDIINTYNYIIKVGDIIDYNLYEGKDYNSQIKFDILFDVYETISTKHYNSENIDNEEIIYSAIEGMVDGSGDKYTTFFPPVESEEFTDALKGEYEGIGAYVSMEEPGILKITTPISGSPAEAAGVKGGDIITHVDDKEIKKETPIREATNWIRGPEGTYVKLDIIRGGEKITIKVKRAKIIIKDIEGELLEDKTTYYIKMRNFGYNFNNDFLAQVNKLNELENVDKIIIDLRNNPGGLLGQVTNVLNYFVPAGEPTAVIKYKDYSYTYTSTGIERYNFSDKEIVVLINSGTASASEILVGTLKDYYPDMVIIGEKTYGKGSVQTMKTYTDGSSLKYTIAKWFTGKTETGIDGVGIIPDIEIELDIEKFRKGYDNQLEEAKKI